MLAYSIPGKELVERQLVVSIHVDLLEQSLQILLRRLRAQRLGQLDHFV